MKCLLFILFLPTLLYPLSLDSLLSEFPEAQLISLPTYSGYSQAVHPDILFSKDGRFILTYTPFPYSDQTKENPYITFSKDGTNFYTPEGINNPIIPWPGESGYNNDPDISYDSKMGRYYLLYQETFRNPPNYQDIVLLSADSISGSWEKDIIQHQDLTKNDQFTLSPSLIINDSYNLFYVNTTGTKRIERVEANSLDSLKFTKSKKISIPIPETLQPWHIDCFKGGEYYYMVITMIESSFYDMNLYLARSRDLQNWEIGNKPLIENGEKFFHSLQIYRSTGLVGDEYLYLWLSIYTKQEKWYIGVKKFQRNLIDSLF